MTLLESSFCLFSSQEKNLVFLNLSIVFVSSFCISPLNGSENYLFVFPDGCGAQHL